MTPRSFLSKVGCVVTSTEAHQILGLSPSETAKVLHRWVKQGWLVRIKQGLYAPLPYDQTNPKAAIDDPWILVPELVGEFGYVCGWSACEHWDLTEQIFHDTSLATQKNVITKHLATLGGNFTFFHVRASLCFATQIVWRKNQRILVSDIHKTIVDIVNTPAMGGGIYHVIDSFKNYLQHSDCNLKQLMDYGYRFKSGTLFKRLGFLSENILGREHDLTLSCLDLRTKGYSALDPVMKKGKIISRWNLIVSEGVKF